MDNEPPVEKVSPSIKDLGRTIIMTGCLDPDRLIILTPTGPLPPADPSTVQKVAELRAIAVIESDTLCGLRLESPSGETGNMVARSDLIKDAFIYQGNGAGIQAAVEFAVEGRRNSTMIDVTTVPVSCQSLLECKLPADSRKVEIKFRFVDRIAAKTLGCGYVDVPTCGYEQVYIILPIDPTPIYPGTNRELILEEVGDGGKGTNACWIVER